MLRKIKLSNLKTSSSMPKTKVREWISVSINVRACQSFLIWTSEEEEVDRALEVALAAEVAAAALEEAVAAVMEVDLHTAVEAEEEQWVVEHKALQEIKMPQCLWEISPTTTLTRTSNRCLLPKASIP